MKNKILILETETDAKTLIDMSIDANENEITYVQDEDYFLKLLFSQNYDAVVLGLSMTPEQNQSLISRIQRNYTGHIAVLNEVNSVVDPNKSKIKRLFNNTKNEIIFNPLNLCQSLKDLSQRLKNS